METGLTGGCACGAVRYRIGSDPWDAGWCHCTICRAVSGAPALAFATVPLADLVFISGAPRSFRSTPFGRRLFCGDCGTPLAMQVDHQPDTIDFTIATLDEPDALAPGFHIFWESRVAWFDPGDGLPRHERFRPDTRGLEGTDPPN